jgi:type I restriction-modification system DNA methylase subunit
VVSDFRQASFSFSHENNGLFADYYLNEIISTLPDWSDDLFADGKQLQTDLLAIRQTIRPETLDEAQLEQQWIQPVLELLGHHFAVQVKIRYRDRGNRRPDYLFVGTAEEAHALTNDIYEPHEIAHAVAIGDAKKWGVRLDQSAPGQRNPSQQIDEYLRYSELDWGILTDGNIWRLYHRESSKYNTYYAVNLDNLLTGDVEPFLYFYAFFRQEAFTTGWLEKVREGSEEFAQKLTDKLEDEVYEALEVIAQGFLDYRRNRLDDTPETLHTIYQQSLVLLYRLLFIFYAESREILPLHENDEYTRYHSLTAIKREAAQVIEYQRALNPDSGDFYNRLRDLFFAIDAGDERLDMPPYNGRLFLDDEHPFLANNMVGDAHLVPALDKLARIDVTEGRQTNRVFVDYRDLDVRHLGSIYEKLLEFQLDIAREPLTTTGTKQQYEAAEDGDAIVKQPGEVFLRTGSNERKITGSYYTPDYIVRFIIEKTLEPLLTDITSRYAEQDEDGRWHVDKPEALITDVLAINVLDPATGSGHFVVDATAYIAEWLRELGLPPADIGDEDELIYWKRMVASACIYAVDINPLAVELAKLSMWLTTLAKGKPLSFLDHHIRVGNSLVGTNFSDIKDANVSVREEERRRKALARKQQKDAAVGQLTLFSDADFTEGVRFAVKQMNAIEGTVAEHVSDVKHQEELYAKLRERLSAWREVADVWTARYFGMELSEDEWKTIRTLTKNGSRSPKSQELIDRAGQLAEDYRFFHWELAFPEIFFDENGQPQSNPGFDAVIGNPPYVRQERISPIKPFLQTRYQVYSGTADLFLYFYELGLEFLRREHRLGYITSGTYMNSNSASAFRQYIDGNATFDSYVDFGAIQPFRGVDLPSVGIVVLRAGKDDIPFRTLNIEGRRPPTSLVSDMERFGFETSQKSTSFDEWRFQPLPVTSLFEKLLSLNSPLSQLHGKPIYSGVKTGLTEAFVISEEKRQDLLQLGLDAILTKPFLRGSDLRTWFQNNSTEYLVFAFNGIDIESNPAMKAYLQNFQEQLVRRSEVTNGSSNWYELRPCSYYDEFMRPKIVWGDISRFPRFSWNDSGDFINNTGFFITDVDYHLLSILQSRLSWFFISQIATVHDIRLGYWRYRVLPQFVERLPIPELTSTQESGLAAIAEEITGLARGRYQVHQNMRHIISTDFGDRQPISTRVALYEWWKFEDERALSEQIQHVFGQEIPLRSRSEWQGFLADEQAKHQDLTAQIIDLEIRMNDIVYDTFDLTPEERQLIEEATKYPYGEV